MQDSSVNLRYESSRLASFANWPYAHVISGERLATSGFHWTGRDDVVRCFECRLELSNWEVGDNPMADHQRWQDRCRFIRRLDCGNVPIFPPDASSASSTVAATTAADAAEAQSPPQRPRDVCGMFNDDDDDDDETPAPRPMARVYDMTLVHQARLMNPGGNVVRGVKARLPKHNYYCTKERRLLSFHTWPIGLAQRPRDLAAAGFYYTGRGDETLCFHCGGGLRDWEPEDIPWEQHARYFPKCVYLANVMGSEFIHRNATTTPPASAAASPEVAAAEAEAEAAPPLPDADAAEAEAEAAPPLPEADAAEAAPVEPRDEITEHIAEGEEDTTTESQPQHRSPQQDYHNDASDKVNLCCKVCYDNIVNTLFLPCRHIVVCSECASIFVVCVICRRKIEAYERVYFA